MKRNKKEKQAVIRYLLAQKVQNNHFHILSVNDLNVPKTKAVVTFLKKANLLQKKVLFVDRGFCELRLKKRIKD